MVDSMMQEFIRGGANGNGGAAGPGNFAIPVLEDGGTELASFMAYKDDNDVWTLYHPLVATPLGIITATLPSDFTAGTYYCHVKKNESAYAATVDQSPTDTTLTSQEEAIVTTKICTLVNRNGKIDLEAQYHVGTIVVDGGSGSGEEVEVDDKSVGKLDDGKLEIKGYHDLDYTETDSLAKVLTTGYNDDEYESETIERGREFAEGHFSPTAVKYRKHGRFVADSATTNMEFTPTAGGNVLIGIYYK